MLPERMSEIDFPKLLSHFIEVQDRHKENKKVARAKDIATLQRDLTSIDT